jgi:hypothetical protein
MWKEVCQMHASKPEYVSLINNFKKTFKNINKPVQNWDVQEIPMDQPKPNGEFLKDVPKHKKKLNIHL